VTEDNSRTESTSPGEHLLRWRVQRLEQDQNEVRQHIADIQGDLRFLKGKMQPMFAFFENNGKQKLALVVQRVEDLKREHDHQEERERSIEVARTGSQAGALMQNELARKIFIWGIPVGIAYILLDNLSGFLGEWLQALVEPATTGASASAVWALFGMWA